MSHYDFILAGGGLAGLSLAFHLIRSPLRERSILIVDKDAKDRNDRTWCFWTKRPTVFDGIVYRSWDRLRFIGEGFARDFTLGDYRYQMIRGIDFYHFVRQELAARPNVTFAQGVVDSVEGGAREARVKVGDQVFTGAWLFDSLYKPAERETTPVRYRDLKQHFKGWEIETQRDAFDPSTPTLFDFRTPQNGTMRFVYMLPFSERRALIEYTLFSAELLKREEYERGLREHIESRLGIGDYRIVEEEDGIIPMTDRPFPRRAGQRVMNIGIRGGRVKPSTGYAFLRVQRDSAAIVQSLLERGHPFGVPRDSAWYRLHDSIMLEVMARNGGRMARIFTDLFKNNPIERVFRFLDEAGAIHDDLRLLASLPPWPFLRALLRSKLLSRISPASPPRVYALPETSRRTRAKRPRTGSSRHTFGDNRTG